jgi:hypothetical protein
MMRRAVVLGAVVGLCAVLFLVGGCTDILGLSGRDAARTGDGGILTVESVISGWVEVYVATAGGDVHWGDSFDKDAYTIVRGVGVYSHYYKQAGVYGVRIFIGEEEHDAVIVPVENPRGYVRLGEHAGMTISVEQWGADLDFYFIEWGDGEGTPITSREYYAEGRIRTHTYAEPGTYTVGIRGSVPEIGMPEILQCFTVTAFE